MQFIGIDLHTNKFTCSYRDENTPPDAKKGERTETFDLNDWGISTFIETLEVESYVLVEATITTFAFVRLIQPFVKEVFVANTYELKQISQGRNNTDKIDANILSRTIKMQVVSKEHLISSVFIPSEDIQELRSLFSTYRLQKKQTTQIKNRIHSLLKEQLYGFTQEEIFDKKSREKIRNLKTKVASLSFQLNYLFDQLEFIEAQVELLKKQILLQAAPYIKEIEILTSMKGISVFIAAAIIADIATVDRFKNSKHFTSYLRSAPGVSSSNTSEKKCGTNKKGRKLASTLITQTLIHVLSASHRLSRWYENQVDVEHKKPGIVRTGLRRKVFTEIYKMLVKGEYHYAREEQKHKAKMSQYRNFLKKEKILLEIA